MKIKELRVKSAEELGKDFIVFKKELFNLRFQKVQGQVEKTHRVRQLKKTVARVKTLLNETKLGINTTRKLGDSVAVQEPKKLEKEIKKSKKSKLTKETKNVDIKKVEVGNKKQKTISNKSKLNKDQKNA